MIEVKTVSHQVVPADLRFSSRVQLHQNPPVFPEGAIRVANIFCHITVKAIIKCVAAMVGTKFFVNTSNDQRAAFATSFFMA